MIRILKESKEDIQRFIDKFGEENYNKLKSLEQTSYVKSRRLNDLTSCVKYFSKDELEFHLSIAENEAFLPKFDKRFGGALTNRFRRTIDKLKRQGTNTEELDEMLDFRYWFKKPKRELIDFIKQYGYNNTEKEEIKDGAEIMDETGSGWKLYKITNYLASEYYGMGSGWCISGAYPGSYSKGMTYFYDYAELYYFIINEVADERYCMFKSKNGRLEIWDGSHGNDIKVARADCEKLDTDAFELMQEATDDLGMSLSGGVPTNKDEQYDIIYDYLAVGLVEVLGGDTFYSYCEKHDLLQLVAEREAEGFYYDYHPEYQFELLKQYTDIMDGYDSFQDIPEEEKKNLRNYYEEYGEAFEKSYDSFKDYFIDMYGDWVSLSYGEASDVLDKFNITASDIAEHIVYDLDKGYQWCEMILDNYE